MPTAIEQQFSAELMRQRQREERMRQEELQRAAEETEAGEHALMQGQNKAHAGRFPITALAVGLWLFPAIALDTLEAFGQLLAAIPVIGLLLAGASSIAGFIFSGIMFLVVSTWLFLQKVTLLTPSGIRIFLALAGAAFGNALLTGLPAWTAFFLGLYLYAHMREAVFNKIKK